MLAPHTMSCKYQRTHWYLWLLHIVALICSSVPDPACLTLLEQQLQGPVTEHSRPSFTHFITLPGCHWAIHSGGSSSLGLPGGGEAVPDQPPDQCHRPPQCAAGHQAVVCEHRVRPIAYPFITAVAVFSGVDLRQSLTLSDRLLSEPSNTLTSSNVPPSRTFSCFFFLLIHFVARRK